MKHVYKRGTKKIQGHILRFMNLMHMVANIIGTYGVCIRDEGDRKWKRV